MIIYFVSTHLHKLSKKNKSVDQNNKRKRIDSSPNQTKDNGKIVNARKKKKEKKKDGMLFRSVLFSKGKSFIEVMHVCIFSPDVHVFS